MKRATGGFTLLEIIIAMSIFAVIGLASNAVLSSVIDSNQLSSEKFDRLQVLQRAMLVLERDLLQAVQRPIRVEGESTDIVINGGENLLSSEADGLGFVRGGWQNPQLMLPRSTLQAVAYRLQEGRLERLYGNYVDNVIGYEPKVRVLMEDIEDFTVEFYLGSTESDQKDVKWEEKYVGTKLPQAVAVTLVSKDFGEIRREFLLNAGKEQ